MSTTTEPIKELSDEDFSEEQIHLIPKLPGQTSDEIKDSQLEKSLNMLIIILQTVILDNI